jgi:ATP-dependent DNA helicase RecQ
MNAPSALRARGLELLRQALADPGTDFRPGQWDAIEALVHRRARLLLVQRTGWGKSAVYFLGTRLLRERGGGPTLLVSPLIALMRNQLDAASRLGIRAETVNSTNRDEWAQIERHLGADEVDVLIVSPERFANEEFVSRMLLPHAGRVGLFVVDEAHCISDWGHDFRPDYRRILRILKRLPPNVPVCATTATANARVIADVAEQLGPNISVWRGPLVRESLRLQTVALPNDAAKLAWLAAHLPGLPGSGIVYALTVRWTKRIAAWLRKQGIQAVDYYGDLSDEERRSREQQLLNNQIKVLVATTALGMGFDKPDLGFVVHFHQPPSVIHYYQQVGRAGRSVSRAYGIMLSGGDDQDINDYFILQAFPLESHVEAVLQALERSEQGLTMEELEAAVNVSHFRIEQVLKTLAVETPPPVARLEHRWVTTAHRYDADRRRRLIEHMTRLRREEQAQMEAYRSHTGCLMEFLARALDDPAAAPCGHCALCKNKAEALREVPETGVRAAVAFLRRSYVSIYPLRTWHSGAFPVYGWSGAISPGLAAEKGRALGTVNDSGWGSLVRKGKKEDGRFAKDLVAALEDLIRRWRPSPAPTWVTCVPSLNHPRLVPDMASRLAARISLPFMPVVRKVRATGPQKGMENSWHQAHNLDGAFAVDTWNGMAGPVFLVDDIFDSRWTFTVVAALLRRAGSGPVFPVALAANR